MLSSELRSVRSSRRFQSVSREYAAVVSRESVAQQYPYTGSCIDVKTNLHEKFQRREFHTTKKSVYKSLCSSQLLLLITGLLQVRAPPVVMVRVWLWPHV